MIGQLWGKKKNNFGLFESFCFKVAQKYSNRITVGLELLSLQVINNPKSTLGFSVIYLQIGLTVG